MLKKLSLITSALSLMSVLTFGCTARINMKNQLGPNNELIRHEAQTELITMGASIWSAADKLSRTGLSGTEAKNVLNGMATEYPLIINICTADTAGKIVTVGRDEYLSYEGAYIGTENVTAPVLTPMFHAVEGMDCVALMRPIISENGDIMGVVSMIFQPETLFSEIAEQWLKGTDFSIDVFQLDGLDIYDSTCNDTGKNLFTDPAAQQFTDLIALGHRMVAEERGTGSYTNIDLATGQTVKKQAYWSTVKLHDTAWRIMSTQVVE